MRRSWLRLGLAVLCCAAVFGPARADDEGERLLAKYRNFIGWTVGDAAINAIRIKGRVADLSSFDEICEPSRFAQYNVGLRSGRPFLVESSAGSGWVSHAGAARDLPLATAQDEFAQSLLLCNAFASYPATLVMNVGTSRAAVPRGFGVVSLSIPHEPNVDLMIDKQTGALTSVVIDGVASYDVADLRTIDATHRIYTRWKRKLPDGTTGDMVITAIQLNVRVDDAIFMRSALDSPPEPDVAPTVTFSPETAAGGGP
jgi:hypothetical protein